MLRNAAASFGCDLNEGETGVVADELGQALVQLKIAVPYAKPEKVKGVTTSPLLTGQSEEDNQSN